jgi:uncharacterized protein YbjT (DUF2867 family)
MKETILVTGASSIIGSALVRQLLLNKVCVRIAVHKEQSIGEFEGCGCPVLKIDYEKKESLEKAFEGINGFFLSVPLRYPRIDDLVLPAIEIAKKHGVVHIVSLGAIGLELDNETPLSILEKCVQHCGLQYTILRPNLLMQNILTLASKSIKESGEIRLPAGDARISFIDARDVAEAAAVALTDPSHRNKMYNLTGPKALNHSDIAAILSSICGRTITYFPVSHNEAKKNLQNQGWSVDNIEQMIGLYEIARHGWCEAVWPDISSLLEREPIDFEKFAGDFRSIWNGES